MHFVYKIFLKKLIYACNQINKKTMCINKRDEKLLMTTKN
jgi:hypothetical protein